MAENEENKPKKRSRKKGCLVILAIVVALIAFSIWRIGEPARRAGRVHQAIRAGMSVAKVKGLLTGRHYCSYELMIDGDWQDVSPQRFMDSLTAQNAAEHVAARLKLTFMGSSPGRISFYVELDADGNVAQATEPYGWD